MTYEEFKKSALNKENESYLDFKKKVLNKNATETNTDPLKTLMNATSTYSIGNDGKLVKTPNMEESKKKTALELLQENQNIGTGDTTYISPEETEKYVLGEVAEKESKVSKKYNSITPIANYVAGDLATDVNEAYAEYANNPTELNKKKLEYAEKVYNDYVANAKNVGKGGLLTKDFATYLPQAVEQFKAGMTGGVVGGATASAVGSAVPVVGNVIGFGGGFKLGYAGGVANYSYEQMQGAMYKALLDLGKTYNVDITHEMALEISKDTALLQSIVEAGESLWDLSSMGISKLFKKGGVETAKDLTMKKIIAKALKNYGINLATEYAEEATQEKIAIEGEKKALSQFGINNPYTKEQEKARIMEAGEGGFKIALVAGTGNVIGTVVVAEINGATLNQINQKYDTAVQEINADDKLSVEQKQTQIAEIEKGRIQVLQTVKEELTQNATKDKELYYIAGVNSQTANKEKLNLAESLEKTKTKAQEIYEKAGWFRGSDGKWSYEIDDSKAQLTLQEGRPNKKYNLSEIYDLSELYEAYPELKDIKVAFSSTLPKNSKGNYNSSKNEITISNTDYDIKEDLERRLERMQSKSADLLFNDAERQKMISEIRAKLSEYSDEKIQQRIKSSLTHEIQHWVQEKEGFPQGSSPRFMKKFAQEEALQKLSNYTQKLIDDNSGNEQLQNFLKDSLEYAKQTVRPKKNLQGYTVVPVDGFSRHLSTMLPKSQYSRLKKLTKDYVQADGYDMYRNTAGEQQARDVQKRMNMTSEERKKTMPFVKDKNTVFVEKVDIKEKEEYDIKQPYIDAKKGIYIDDENGIWYEKNGISKDEVHYGEKLYQAIDADTPKLRKNKIYSKEFGDYLFVFTKNGHNDYNVISQTKIEGNEEFSKVIKEEIKNGTFGSTETIIELIKKFNGGNGANINNNDSSKRGRKDKGIVEKSRGITRQSTINDRKNLGRINENINDVENSEKGSNFLPQTYDEAEASVKSRITPKIEEDIKKFAENKTYNYEEIDGRDVDNEATRIMNEIYTAEEIDYLVEEDLYGYVFDQIVDLIGTELGNNFYTFDSNTDIVEGRYIPDAKKLEDSDEIRLKYNEYPSTDFEFAQLDKIRDRIYSLVIDMEENISNEINIGIDESRASADATYITIYNENTDEMYEIRVGNHFKSGVSGHADKHISISDFKTITELENEIRRAINDGFYSMGIQNQDTKYSLSDNKGRKLSKGQQEYFKDSKVRDKEGRLLEVYHGTTVGNFNIFDAHGITWVTPSESYAEQYVRYYSKENKIYKLYANITNPIFVGDINNEVNTQNLENLSHNTGIDIEELQNIDNEAFEYIWEITNSEAFKTLAKKKGYDGIEAIEGTEKSYGAFDSNQIKRVDNLNPTEDDDIRYDLMPTMKDGFYSQLENVIINKMQKQAKASDIMNLIQKNGVKQDEIAWTGVDDFLASRDTVTKEELLQYIRANQIEIEEVIKSEKETLKDIDQHMFDLEAQVIGFDMELDEILSKYELPTNLKNHIFEDEGEMYNRLLNSGLIDFDDNDDIISSDGPVSEYAFMEDLKRYIKTQDAREEIQHEIDDYYNAEGEYAENNIGPKFKEYSTIFGGVDENYREILYRMPNIKDAPEYYKREHWDDISNIFAHTRLRDYEDDGGAKVLFIEEIQSDMHQEGRRYGYTDEPYKKLANKVVELEMKEEQLRKELVQELHPKRQKIEFEIMEKLADRNQILIKDGIRQGDFETGLLSLLYEKTNPEEYKNTRKEFYNIDTKFLEDEDVKNLMGILGLPPKDLEKIVKIHNELSQKYDELMEVRKNIFGVFENNEELSKIHLEIAQLREKMYANMHKIYSKFPFKKNWYEFIIRKQINEAVQNGYDKVAWTTGTQQNDRYNLAKYIEEIRYAKYDDGRYYINAIDKNADENFLGVKNESELEELVGKEIANKIISGEYDKEGKVAGTPFDATARGIIENTDLEIGGEGMIGFYDKIVPDYVNKYIKKWNSKVEEVRIPDVGGKVHVQQGFTITPEMRKSVQEIGQPLYDKEPTIDTMSRKNIIEKIRETTGIEYFANTNKELNSIASEIREKIKGRKITTTDIKNIADEIGQKLITRVGGKKASIKDFFIDTYGKDGWNTIAQSIADEIKAIRDEYDLENPIDTSKRARVADKETKEILNALGFEDKDIYDPANGYIQNLMESIEKNKEYYSRPLKEIEQDNLMYGYKEINTILNKRRFDVQNGLVEANPNFKEGASLSTMRREIEKYLGKKIGFGGFRKRAYGIYKPSLDTIRIKDRSNIETAIHELGHRINYKELDQTLKGASRKELMEFCERSFGDAYDDDPTAKLEEGWAEFTKRFIVDNQTTIEEYPETSAYMIEQLEGNKNMREVVEKLIDLSEQYVNAPIEQQIRRVQSVGQETDSKQKRGFFDKIMYEIYDELWHPKKMMKVFAKEMGLNYWQLAPEDNVYNLLRIYTSNKDRIINVLKTGLIDDNGRRRTTGLKELYEKLNDDAERIQEVRDLMLAMRALDYGASNYAYPITPAEAMQLIKKYKDDSVLMEVASGTIKFQQEILKYAVEKGLMTEEQMEEIQKHNLFYMPSKRVMDGKVNSSSASQGASKLVKQRKGSLEDIIDPFESIVQNTAVILQKIYLNDIMQTLVRLQNKTGNSDFYEVIDAPQQFKAQISLEKFKNYLEEQGVDTDEIDLDFVQTIFTPMMNDKEKMIVGYMDKGKLKAIEFKDRFVYEAITQGGTNTIDTFYKLFSASQVLRFGATSGNVEFAIPNMTSDTMTAWMFSESGFVPLIDTFKGLVDYSLANYSWADNLTKDSKYKQQNKFLYDLYKQSGATMATRVGSYRPEVQEYVLEIFGKHANDLLSDDVNVQKEAGKEIMKKLSRLLGKTQDVLSILPELSEQATRFEHFKKDYLYAREQGHNHKNALLKATINTRDITMDFNRLGHTMRAYNRYKAFAGARAQGIYRFAEAVSKMPTKVLGKLGVLVGIALVLKAGADASGNKKEEEITDQVRKDNFIIPLGKDGEIVTIKKIQGFPRSAINLAETLYDVVTGKVPEEDYDKVWNNWVKDTIQENAPLELDLREGNDIWDILATAGAPTAIEPLVEVSLNRDFYYGNPIIPYGKEDESPENQYDENTSPTAILLGKAFGQSPAKIEHLITGYLAGIGSQALDLSDTILGKMSKDIPDQPSKELSEKFILKRFFANSFKNSDSVSEVYEQSDRLTKLEKRGEASETELETLEKLNSAKKTMSDLNKQIKRVRNSLTLTSDQKRDKIKELQILRTDVARNALGKELINPASKEQVELYEYYPSKTTFKYEVHANKTVEVEYTEDDMREYARIVKDTYETALAKEQKKRTYQEMTAEEQKKKRNSLLTSAKSSAQEKVSREIYRRSR